MGVVVHWHAILRNHRTTPLSDRTWSVFCRHERQHTAMHPEKKNKEHPTEVRKSLNYPCIVSSWILSQFVINSVVIYNTDYNKFWTVVNSNKVHFFLLLLISGESLPWLRQDSPCWPEQTRSPLRQKTTMKGSRFCWDSHRGAAQLLPHKRTFRVWRTSSPRWTVSWYPPSLRFYQVSLPWRPWDSKHPGDLRFPNFSDMSAISFPAVILYLTLVWPIK